MPLTHRLTTAAQTQALRNQQRLVAGIKEDVEQLGRVDDIDNLADAERYHAALAKLWSFFSSIVDLEAAE